jgi:hypothetical protein
MGALDEDPVFELVDDGNDDDGNAHNNTDNAKRRDDADKNDNDGGE